MYAFIYVCKYVCMYMIHLHLIWIRSVAWHGRKWKVGVRMDCEVRRRGEPASQPEAADVHRFRSHVPAGSVAQLRLHRRHDIPLPHHRIDRRSGKLIDIIHRFTTQTHIFLYLHIPNTYIHLYTRTF